jgi:hypothetical protein
MKNKRIAYRQGENLFEKIDSAIGYKLEKLNTKTIREGELTGHKHEIVGNAELWKIENFRNDDMILTADKDIKIVHPEHKTLDLPKGIYRIRIQREYDELRERLIRD